VVIGSQKYARRAFETPQTPAGNGDALKKSTKSKRSFVLVDCRVFSAKSPSTAFHFRQSDPKKELVESR
jgi:hypothetical protein